MRIGIAGIGKMGAAMAARLQDSGADVHVWNRSRDRAEASGLPVADSPRALAEQVETVITSLFDDPAVEAVYHGPNGLLPAAAGKLFIEMSTVRPVTQERLAAAVRQAGGVYVECPVGGTTGPARSGQLLGLAGGETQDVAQARPVLDLLCRRVEHVGQVGAGASAKLAINLPLAVFWQAFGEAMGLIRHLHLDPAYLVDLFADTAGGPNILKARSAAIASALGGHDPGAPTFDLDSIRKDLRTMLAEAESRGFTVPVAARTLDAFNEASAAGLGPRDCSLLPAFWAKKAEA